MVTRDFQKQSLLGIFVSYFRPHMGLFLLDMACALMISLIDLAFPFVSRTCMNVLIPESRSQAFFAVIAVMLCAYVLRAGLQYVVCYWGHTFGVLVEADIRKDLFSHLQTLSFGFYDKNRTGHLMSRMTAELFDITELAHHGPEDLFISGVTVVGAIVIMFTIQWRLALVMLLLVPTFVVVVNLNRRNMIRASRRVKQNIASINADIESSISGMRTAKAFSNENAESEKFSGANERFKTSKKERYKAMAWFMCSMEFFTCILPVAVIAVGGALIMNGEMNYIDLTTFFLYTSTFINPMRKLANLSEMLVDGIAGLGRFVELMRIEPDLKDKPDALVLSGVEGSIDVDNVSFSYERDDVEVLHHVSLHVAPGETVAVVGPSGGGKTTLCSLIPRFYDVGEGSIRIDGHDVRDVQQQSLRRNIGVVQQDVFLFAASILDNIRYGRPGASTDEVIAAAKRAEIYDDIMAMPDGFDTYVGERGALLSGGQKQRISIARIFLKNPPVLILDEATSALDSVTEAKIQRAFDELAKGRTTIIIAHRLSTVRAASRILVIRDGVIAEQGTHNDLLARGGDYAQLYNTQNLHR
ncbi:MAG: ABC transporter ATP-binding protein/permease [Oscillospiraceae bacterium]|jgi:ATP-binding cassette subfamily B protein|nr:ABC transporter ATP-binding protein [Oscillospiraceae bacterium]MDE6935127.1 ABC transporter ATP-binding protein/permease [Oscillospiraceae bacterium]